MRFNRLFSNPYSGTPGSGGGGGGGGEVVIPARNVAVQPSADIIVGKTYKTYAAARAYAQSQVPSAASPFGIIIYEDLAEDIPVDRYQPVISFSRDRQVKLTGKVYETGDPVVVSIADLFSQYVVSGFQIDQFAPQGNTGAPFPRIIAFIDCYFSPQTIPVGSVGPVILLSTSNCSFISVDALNVTQVFMVEGTAFGTDFPQVQASDFNFSQDFLGGTLNTVGGGSIGESYGQLDLSALTTSLSLAECNISIAAAFDLSQNLTSVSSVLSNSGIRIPNGGTAVFTSYGGYVQEVNVISGTLGNANMYGSVISTLTVNGGTNVATGGFIQNLFGAAGTLDLYGVPVQNNTFTGTLNTFQDEGAGTPTKIEQGDSKVEVIDTGTGSAVVTIDGTPVGTFNASGFQLASGATVNEFSIDGTLAGDSDTAIPTEKAVKTYADGLIRDQIGEGDSKIEVIDTGTGSGVITMDGTPVATFTVNGLQMASGADINEFSTDGTLADDSDDAVPTEKAVKTYVDAKDFIKEGDSKVEVVDAGSGTITIVIDNQTVATFTGISQQLFYGTSINEFSIDGTLSGDSDDAVPTEKAVKAYVDGAAALYGPPPKTLIYDAGSSDVVGVRYNTIQKCVTYANSQVPSSGNPWRILVDSSTGESFSTEQYIEIFGVANKEGIRPTLSGLITHGSGGGAAQFVGLTLANVRTSVGISFSFTNCAVNVGVGSSSGNWYMYDCTTSGEDFSGENSVVILGGEHSNITLPTNGAVVADRAEIGVNAWSGGTFKFCEIDAVTTTNGGTYVFEACDMNWGAGTYNIINNLTNITVKGGVWDDTVVVNNAGASVTVEGVAMLNISASAGTLTFGVDAGAVAEADFDANTILKADSDNTPLALTMNTNTALVRSAGNIEALAMAASSVLGRTSSGNVDDLTMEQLRTELETPFKWQSAAVDGLLQNIPGDSNWYDRVTLTTPVLTAGNYIILWAASIGSDTNDTSKTPQVRVYDNTTATALFTSGPLYTPNGSERQPYGSFVVASLTGVSHSIRLQWMMLDGSKQISISDAKLFIWRVN